MNQLRAGAGRHPAFILFAWFVVGATALATIRLAHGADLRLKFDYSLSLPDITIDGQAARIHTQGLYVDDEHIYVTGRLERQPKRPLFLRFERADTGRFAAVDLSLRDGPLAGEGLDHPGGFDFDGESFWIPLARSRPDGPSTVLRIRRDPAVALESWPRSVAFQADDHIGAIAFEKESGLLYGANWDTKRIAVWRTDGTLEEAIPRETWISGAADWALAVQDWKSASGAFPGSPGTIVAGGIDKAPRLGPGVSRAVVELYRPKTRQRLARAELPAIAGWQGPATNEGMCLYGRWLVLLPADIGQSAKLYFFKLRYEGTVEPTPPN